MTLHLEVTLGLPLLPLSPRGEIQARRLIRLAADIPCADNGMTIRHRKIEQTARLNSDIVLGWNFAYQLIDPSNGLHHHLTQKRLSEALGTGVRARIGAFLFEEIKEQSKCPLAVRAALDAQVPLVGEGLAEGTLDVVPPADAAVVHPHKGVVLEGMAIVVCESALCGGANMGEDQIRACLGRETFQVLAVPCW